MTMIVSRKQKKIILMILNLSIHSVVQGGASAPSLNLTTLDLYKKPDIIKESIINNRTHNE